MRIATWNVNSIKARLPRVVEWLQETAPDVALLQEIKVQDQAFPAEAIEELGYNVLAHGQKTYNGVAILSRQPIEDPLVGLPGDEADEQARYLEATVGTVRVAAIYLPNGNPVESDKFGYKLGWMDRLKKRAEVLLSMEESVVLGGDYNVCPLDQDCYDPAAFADDALCRPETRSRFGALLNLGLTEAFRAQHPGEIAYSFWDYQAGAWQKDHGLRIDHLLLSPEAADRLLESGIDKRPRGRERPSDHTPVWCELAD